MDRKVTGCACLKIPAADWLSTNDVTGWVNDVDSSVATWYTGSGYRDVFTIYDHGDGPDREEMPDWLWDRIDAAAQELGLSYAVVWLEDVDP